ncbi:MAG: condensation domain-containing protein, partial [Cyanobacteria bacterium J06643_4]
MSPTIQNQATQKRAVQDIYPLSPTQRGLLFHSLYEEDGAGNYIVQVSYTLRGYLDRHAFETAWQQLVNRHSILRTAFVWEQLEAPVQVVGQQALLPVNWQNWAHLSTEEQHDKFEDLLSSDRARGFHLSKAPLMRVIAIQLSKKQYRILWTHHHILLDGWSLPILFKEWISLYKTACLQESAFPVKLSQPRPYKHYIAWLQKQDIAAAKQFWAKQLAGISAPTPITIGAETVPTSERKKAQPFESEYLTLSETLSNQLKQFAQQQRVTLSTLVQGAWAKLLSVYSGETTVLYGLARAGRPNSLEDADSRVGLFINTLPMRAEMLSSGDTVTLLQQIQSQQLAQQPYEYTPLVDVHAASEIARQLPLFESVIVFENYPLSPAKDLAGLDLVEISITEQTHYPLTLFAVATDAIEFKLIYDTQRFSHETITQILTHLRTALTEMVTHPQQSVNHLSILSEKEHRELSHFGQGPVVDVSQLPVQVAIAQQATSTPQSTALIFEGHSLTYAQLNNQANQLARYLQQRIAPGELVGLCVERSVDMIVSLLAILKAGCAYVPLDPTYPVARLQHTLENAGVAEVICHQLTQHIFAKETFSQGNSYGILNLDDARKVIAAQPISSPAIATEPGNLAYVIYTSGSTGSPKGVPITHQNLSNLLASMATRLRIQPSDTLMAVTTLAFDIAGLELFLPLITGAK